MCRLQSKIPSTSKGPNNWEPPPARWVDAAVEADKAMFVFIVHDHLGKPIGGWTFAEIMYDVFDDEVKGFLLACRVGEELKVSKLLIEGDSLGVV